MTTQSATDKMIEFHFDFASPFGYFAAQEIEDLAARHGRRVAWRPLLLGAVFKETGARPLTEVPMKAGYTKRDIQRIARRMGVPLQMPKPFPFATIAACRAFYWLDATDPEAAKALAIALYNEAFSKGGEISKSHAVVQVAAGLGHDAGQVEAALKDPEVKECLRLVVQSAIKREIFGSPFFLVDGEPFWGYDRMNMLEAWLESGGW